MKKSGITCIVLLAILLLTYCEYDPVNRAIKTTNYVKGVECVDQVSDSLLISKIVMEAKNMQISMYALEKLSNQALLSKVALSSRLYPPEYAETRIAALEKITDQSMLADILISCDTLLNISYSYKVRFYETAIANLTDLNILSELLYRLETTYFKNPGLNRIYDMLTGDTPKDFKISNKDTKNTSFKTTEKLIQSFKKVPREDAMRNLRKLLPAFKFLLLPDVLKETGEVRTVTVSWRSTSAYYMGDFSGSKPGERLSCTFSLQKIPGQVSKTWSTRFPQTVSNLNFNAAPVKYEDLLDPVVEKLSDTVKQIYAEYKH